MDSFVGPYRIVRLINRGGQGSVYLGFDKRLHRRVAIKIYDLPRTRSTRNQLLQEARLVASAQSPKVVQIHDVIASGSHLAMVMEYVPGCNLEQLLQTVRPSLASIITVATDVAGALAIAKQRRIVHGDVKAGNILINEQGRAVLTDFGIARVSDSHIRWRLTAGSPSAVSPEQYLGQSVDNRTDLFALGVLIYRMMSGEHPFCRDGKLNAELLLRQPHRPLKEIVGGEVESPEALMKLLDDLLQKDPQLRPPNTRRVRQVLRDLSRDIPLSASNSLLREARPSFRKELPEDIPLKIPAGLGQQGRSQLLRGKGRLAWLWHKFSLLGRPARATVSLAVVTLIATLVVVAVQNRATAIAFEEPKTSFHAAIKLPREVSRSWLLNEVKSVISEELGELHVIGPIGAGLGTTLYSQTAAALLPQYPEQTFQTTLRCSDTFCVFAVSRDHAGAQYHGQGILFPDMSLQQWQDIVRVTTQSLYP
ncbi:MAG: serine/threonine protein kinase [Halioglobus sp.]|jgi:serine/threonine protein kinase